MAQERYLSPRQVLSYLCHLEQKLPKRSYKIYIPSHSHDIGEVTPAELNEECQRMLNFAGMEGYKAEAVFAKLDAGAAGNTIPGKTPGGVVHINVSDGMTNNWKAVLATLAHEICHQVIYRHGIHPEGSQLEWMVETYTDLCTIYVGFGQLVLEGYKTNVAGVKQTLGYLDWNTYEVTNHMVNVVCGGVQSSNTGLSGSDIFADEAIELWEKETDKRQLLKNTFRELASPMAELQRNITLIEQLAALYREEMKSRTEELSKSFFSDVMATDGTTLNTLSAFRCIYEANIDREGDTAFSRKISSLDETIESVLYQLYMRLKESHRVVFSNDFVCPVCGKRFKGRSSDEGAIIIKCSCGTHFVLNTDQWNLTRQQRRVELQRMEMEKKANDEFEHSVAAKRAAFERSMSDQRSAFNLDMTHKKDELNQQQKYIDNHRAEVAKEYTQLHFPVWLRWLTKKYFINK